MRIVAIAVAITILVAFVIAFIVMANKRQKESEIQDAFDSLGIIGGDKNKRKMFFFEMRLVEKFSIEDSHLKMFLLLERIIIVALCMILYIIFGVVGFAFIGCLAVWVIMDNKLKMKIYDSGITRIDDTIAFMDYFVPSIASGKSAIQSFTSYIEKLDPESNIYRLLTEYWDRKVSNDYTYTTPDAIKDICSVFENAQYNEDKGVDDYLYIIEEAKADLFQKSTYYADYNSRMKEAIVPTSAAYYVGVPVITLMLFGTFGDFWFSEWGLVAAVMLVILFAAFQWLINKLSTDTIEEIL